VPGSLRGVDDNVARERLEGERKRVSELIADLKVELGEAEGDSELADYDQHPADSASDTFEREKDLSILESLESELGELEAALARLEAGRYGVDEETGEPIVEERLEAVPTARTNVESAKP